MKIARKSEDPYKIYVSSIDKPLLHGAIIEIDGVLAIERISRKKTERLRQFVVTRDAKRPDKAIQIYPPVLSARRKYGTVWRLPDIGAKIRIVHDGLVGTSL